MTKSQKIYGYLMALVSTTKAHQEVLKNIINDIYKHDSTSPSFHVDIIIDIKKNIKKLEKQEKFYEDIIGKLNKPEGDAAVEVLHNPHHFMYIENDDIVKLVEEVKEPDLFSEEDMKDAFECCSTTSYHKLLLALIDDNFGLYGTLMKGLGPDADDMTYLSFLPSEIYEKIPAEFISEFRDNDNAFGKYMNDLLEFTGVLDSIPPERNAEADKIIKKRVKRFIKEYKKVHGYSIKTRYKIFHGLRNHSLEVLYSGQTDEKNLTVVPRIQ